MTTQSTLYICYKMLRETGLNNASKAYEAIKLYPDYVLDVAKQQLRVPYLAFFK